MHYHRHDDVVPCDADHDWPDWAQALFATIIHLEVQLMAQQDQINTDVQQIGDALTTIAQEIDAQKAQIAAQAPNADLSGLDAVAQKAKDLAAAAVPADPAAPAAPAADPNAPAATDVNPAPTL